MDFNEGISLEQPITAQGDKRFNVTFSKVTKQWSAKPIKEKEGSRIFTSNGERKYQISNKLPKNIAGVQKADKTFVIGNQKLRFRR